MSPDQAATWIPDGGVVAITGSGGGLLGADAIFAAIERRFLATGKPSNLTLVHALGFGDRARRGTNRFAHPGLVKTVIGGHWGWSPRMQQLAYDGAIAAYALPAGVISHLLREIGAGRLGLITRVGLGTFVDPRHGGGKLNAAAKDDVVEVIELGGEEYLWYKPFNVDVGIVRGTYADDTGHLALTDEPANLDGYAVALAAHNSNGVVLAQVREAVPAGSLEPRAIQIPGLLIDAIVPVADQQQTYRNAVDSALSSRKGNLSAPSNDAESIKNIIVRRAARELTPGAAVNFGFGAPAAIASMLADRKEAHHYWMTIEQSIHGGRMNDDDLFGMAYHPEVIVDSTSQFDFYSGGGLDFAFLGMAEMDGEGNVNVSRINGRINGPGGFVDTSQNAKIVVFCGTFDAKESKVSIDGARLRVLQAGKIRKLVKKVLEMIFSGAEARRREQRVLYVTERATFTLTQDGIELIEIAPGIDLQTDGLDLMDFNPIVRNVGIYPDAVMASAGARP